MLHCTAFGIGLYCKCECTAFLHGIVRKCECTAFGMGLYYKYREEVHFCIGYREKVRYIAKSNRDNMVRFI